MKTDENQIQSKTKDQPEIVGEKFKTLQDFDDWFFSDEPLIL